MQIAETHATSSEVTPGISPEWDPIVPIPTRLIRHNQSPRNIQFSGTPYGSTIDSQVM